MGSVEYRCRRCGKVDAWLMTSNLDHSLSEVAQHGEVRHAVGFPCRAMGTHHCADGGIGITDCIGGHEDKPNDKPPLLADGWTLLGWRKVILCWELCAATEEHGGVIGWWWRDETGRWGRHRTSSEVDQSRLPDELWNPPLRVAP